MSLFNKRIKQASLAVVLLSLGAMQSALAVGTAAGTNITNTAAVNFTVGGVAQTAVNSNPATFTVDRKVDLNVTAVSATNTNPGALNAPVLYTVTNTGNGTDSFNLVGSFVSGPFTPANIRVYRDNGATPNVFDGTDTLVAGAVSFTADQSIQFFVVSDIPLAATNGQSAIVKLTATTTSTQTVGADTAGVDVVFADTGHDGTEAANNQYNIQAATLAVVKSAAIISDPVNGVGANRKAIPGAVIEYTIVITNSGAANAAAVTVSDPIPTNSTYVANSMVLNAAALTDAADADAGTTTGAPVTSISVNTGTVNASGGTATVKFRVTIN
jgi:uncharacterized repeat protein (TIGR01451 family)